MRTRSRIITIALLVLLPALFLFNACTKTKTVDVVISVYDSIQMGPIRPVTPTSNQYVTNFFEYNPAPGQFVNSGLGDSAAAAAVVKNLNGLVSLGAFGGYAVYGFDHTVIDSAGPDLLVIGNAISEFAEPGIVWVMQDQNGNGKPDDTWYELAGSETGQPGYIRNYSVTYTRPNPKNGSVPWKDNMGHSGFVLNAGFYSNDLFPDSPHAATYTLTGTLLPSINIDTTDPTYVTSAPFAYGYCDNSVGGDYVDIGTAIDSLSRPVHLKGIDFVKIQTGILANMGWLGEQSTEVTGIVDVRMMNR